MKIAILGTRGIPNNYGGFEQFAEYLSIGLVQNGHDVTVYNSLKHVYKDNLYKGVKIKHIYDPEYKLGTAGQFVYDFLSILDSRKGEYDIIFQLGYTSSSLFFDLHPKKSVLITNMDGLEWKRSKYTKLIQKFLQFAEKLAIKKSDFLISDSIGIQSYLKEKYSVDSTYIPYGSFINSSYRSDVLKEYGIEKYKYNMLIARLEPENSIEVILDGVVMSNSNSPFLVIGNYTTKYGLYLAQKYKNSENIKFIGAIYNQDKLNDLRYFSNLYFHGHTVGGTNPSLLEAMGSEAFICANDNIFNRAILNDDAVYFKTSEDVSKNIKKELKENNKIKLVNNIDKIQNIYKWDNIIKKYNETFIDILNESKI